LGMPFKVSVGISSYFYTFLLRVFCEKL